MSRTLYAALAVILVSCAGLNKPSDHVIRGARLTPYGGFQTLSHDAEELRMGLRKNGEKWAIEAWTINIPEAPASLGEFKRRVKENEVVFRDKNTYEVLAYEIDEFAQKGSWAVLSKMKVKDKSADPRYAFLSAYEMSCIHPAEKSLGYNVMISRRGNSSDPDAAFDSLAIKILDSFAYTNP